MTNKKMIGMKDEQEEEENDEFNLLSFLQGLVTGTFIMGMFGFLFGVIK